MRPRILDLDGSLIQQSLFVRRARPTILPLREWGPRIRMACGHRSFKRFETCLTQLAGSAWDEVPHATFVGSGDFHHVSLALLRRLRTPVNLLVLDNHPDWMRGIPLLHCGTWLFHAARLPRVRRIFHVGGEVDFDNHYRWLAPWKLIQSGKLVVAPACRPFRGKSWDRIEHRPLRLHAEEPAGREDIDEWLALYRSELAACPLYISLDKDVLTAEEAAVNWDSGRLTLPEVLGILDSFRQAADGELAGIDIVGDWSRVQVAGLLRRLCHWTEHPTKRIDTHEATRQHEALNLLLLAHVSSVEDNVCALDTRTALRTITEK